MSYLVRRGTVVAVTDIVDDDPAYLSVTVECPDDEYVDLGGQGSTSYRLGLTGHDAVQLLQLARDGGPPPDILFAGRLVVRHEPSTGMSFPEVEAEYVGLAFTDPRIDRA
ncbi:hypothetical protein ES689_08255 [Frigoribacterium sp. ACAM 257]|uniref:hypothetical protein n=1 Tax=Frigoribacterium sp. ACAM 257 TaxID=2508998 RepID=UPI0011B9C6CA|nr:hypothetical protein [Frigoribacterium sp. ACAM 257]TWX38603.1 hypothetical protein ES689_08255 [Frigoribacterium sp. ACAM 257]